MKYTVVWHPSALDRLAMLWMNTTDRNAVARASDEIDRKLRYHPLDVGESREHILRILLERPLGVHYFVSSQDRVVYVISVWQTHRNE